VSTQIAAPVEKVWKALTLPHEVCAWDGVSALDVPADYPRAGQHARWHSAFGPLRLTLHDHVSVIEERQRMVATIDIAFVHIDEEYRLCPIGDSLTLLVTDDEVTSRIPGLRWLAVRLTRANVVSSMERLKSFCEGLTPM